MTLKASNLSFEKKIAPSDAIFYGTTWDKRHDSREPLKVVTKTILGTIDNALTKEVEKDALKLNAKIESANIHTIDHCSLKRDQDTLVVEFTVKVLSGMHIPCTCNIQEIRSKLTDKIGKYIPGELARRYAINLASGRFLWRNRVGASQVEIVVSPLDRNMVPQDKYVFDGYDYPLDNFQGTYHPGPLVDDIAMALSGADSFKLFSVTAYALIGKGQDVYPSQEMVHEKNSKAAKEPGAKSKVLYHEDGIAAMHSQKVGNAIRTIDTWHPGKKPIAINSYGSVTRDAVAYRQPKEKIDFYSLLDKMVDDKPLTDGEEHFLMATFIKGGVFGRKKGK